MTEITPMDVSLTKKDKFFMNITPSKGANTTRDNI